MFNDEEPIAFKRMHDFSTVDGFVEITENLGDMIKFVANEPSVGLFYVQQHAQNAAPNLLHHRNNIIEKSHETSLHAQDLEDSITMVASMKECGFPIADEMIKDIKKSLSIISSKQPKRGLIHNSSPGFLGRTSSWSPATWGRSSVYSHSDGESNSGYLSSVFKSAKQRANSFKRAQVESREGSQPIDHNSTLISTVDSPMNETEAAAATEDLPVSSDVERELQEESQLSKSLSHQQFLSLYENYDEFKADREAKLEEWLGGKRDESDRVGKNLDEGASTSKDMVP